MFQRFNHIVRQIMARAKDEARRWRHNYIGTEHMLLMLADTPSTARQVLQNLGADAQKIRAAIEPHLRSGPDTVVPGQFPQTPLAKQAIEFAIEESRHTKALDIGSVHLLLGILRTPEGLGAKVLAELGITLESARNQIAQVLNNAPATASDPHAAEFWRQLLESAEKARATDIHLDPLEAGRGRLRFRVDGALHDVGDPLTPDLFRSAVDQIRVMSGMDVSNPRSSHDGRVRLTLASRILELFVSTILSHRGPRVVVRILRPDATLLPLDQLGLSDADLTTVQRLSRLPKGLVIVTGPTGCGKTTLLYDMLLHVNRPEVSIVTVEDPVEYAIDGIVHVQIDPPAGMGFPRVIRSLLRQAPNIIMVGEVRDLETLQLCAQAALTGHLLLTTLHTDSAVTAITRMRDIGLEPFLINGTLAGVIAMRLVRVLCPHCKQPADPAPHLLPPQAKQLLNTLPNAQFFAPKGCPQCTGSGYHGRTGVFEILVMDDNLRHLVDQGADTTQLLAAARQAGAKTLFEDALTKVAKGLTSLDEILPLGLTHH